MKKSKVLSIILILAVLMSSLTMGGVFADVGSNPTALDISQGDITIKASGASGGGLTNDEETLNPDGYIITGSTTQNKVVIETGVEADIRLSDVSIEVTGGSASNPNTAFAIKDGAKINLDIAGKNIITSAIGAGIALRGSAELHIDGRGSLDVTGGRYPAIGSGSASTGLSGVIEINGGVITAIAKGSAARASGIGGMSGNSGGNIIINGGFVTAESSRNGIASIGDGAGATASRENAVIVNGGSVNATIQGTPQNRQGDALRLVTADVEDGANKVFEFMGAGEDRCSAQADENGKLYLYMKQDAESVSVNYGSESYLGNIIVENDVATAKLIKYEGILCTCTEATAGIKMDGGNITVNSITGSTTINLDAVFEHADNCEYPQHVFVPQYVLSASVSDDDAVITGRKLTVNLSAANKDIMVVVSGEVNGTRYEKRVVFNVTSTDTYEFDLAEGSIVLHDGYITVGDKQYSVPDKSRPIRIKQNKERDAANNRIEIAAGVTGVSLIFDNLSITQSGAQTMSPVTVGDSADVTIELVGDNLAEVNGNSFLPAVNVALPTSKLTITGEGTLTARGGMYNVGIGGSFDGRPGQIVIEGGKVTAIGGYPAAAGIGAGPHGTPGSLIIKGGTVIARSGRGAVNDIFANTVIDGGSVAVEPDRFSEAPVNSGGETVHLTTATMKDIDGEKDITYYIKNGDNEEGSAIDASLDDSGKAYLYLPAESDVWNRIRARIDGDTTDYYKRLIISPDDENTAELTNDPQGRIESFLIGQFEGIVDEEAKTITVNVPNAVDLTAYEPTVNAGGLEVRHIGSISNPDDEVKYYVIKDDESEIVYTVNIVRQELDPDTMFELNISVGNIVMNDDDHITIGGLPVLKNTNGYIITGSSDTNVIFIGDITVPVIFKDVKIAEPTLNGELYSAPLSIAGSDVNIEIQGVNSISAAAGNAAMMSLEDSKVTVTGEGILELKGGSGNPGAAKESTNTEFIIGGASIFVTDGENASANQAVVPVNSQGVRVYPVEITVDYDGAAGTVVKYGDNNGISEMSLLTNEDGKIRVYRPVGKYEVTVETNGAVLYGTTAVSGLNNANNPAKVTVSLARVTGLLFTDPLTSFATKFEVTLVGVNLGGTIVITASGRNGEIITKNAEPDENNIWKAVLDIPANESLTDVNRYNLSVTANGISQTLEGNTFIDMLRKLAITSFILDDNQLGESLIDDEAGTISITIPYDMDLQNSFYTPSIEYTEGARLFPAIRPSNFSAGASYNLEQAASIGSDDVKRYSVEITQLETPVVSEITFNQPADYYGGNVEITLTGSNFENLSTAANPESRYITVSAAGYPVNISHGDENGVWKVTIPVPSNENGMRTVRYPITVTINGVEQPYTGEKEIVVPARIEGIATIEEFTIEEQISSEIDYVGEGEDGTVNILMPTGHDVTALIPAVTLTNPNASYALYNASGAALTIGEPIDFTEPVTLVVTSEDGSNTKRYIVTVTVEARRSSGGRPEKVTEEKETFKSYISGYEDGTFRPNGHITRAEAASLFARLEGHFDENRSYGNEFFDIEDGTWYTNYVSYAAGKGIVNGYEGNFRPLDNVTRMEFAAMVDRFAGDSVDSKKSGEEKNTAKENKETHFSDIEGMWGESAVTKLSAAGIVGGYEDGTFRPNDNITRAEAVKILNSVIGRELTEELETAISEINSPFSDLNENHWAYLEIMRAAKDYTITTQTKTKGLFLVTGKEIKVDITN